MEQSITLSILISMTGCFVGLAGWLSGRDKKIVQDSKWQEGISKDMNYVVQSIAKTTEDVEEIKETLVCHDKRITRLEEVSHAGK